MSRRRGDLGRGKSIVGLPLSLADSQTDLPLTNSFYEGNLTPIRLLVDLKTRGNETYHAVLEELEPLRKRQWLTRWNATHVIPG